jgi:hypothetical protein
MEKVVIDDAGTFGKLFPDMIHCIRCIKSEGKVFEGDHTIKISDNIHSVPG